ncbi:MAG TPA: carbohydrate ABC transporter permease [Spirochaetia bacterium]|nr:carbohydrate ABC transporter permease [Spirochaetia bacterium]
MSSLTSRPRLRPARFAVILILLVLAAVYLGPLLTVVNVSLQSRQQFNLNPTAIVQHPQLENFVTAWNKANFPLYLRNSLLYTVIATALYVVTAVFVAFPIARRYVRASGFLFSLFVVALFLPYALIPQFQLMLHLRLYNTAVGYVLLFLVDPIGIVILVNYIRSIPRELDEAAAMDGSGYVRFVARVLFPLIKPALASVIVLHSIGIWNEYVIPLIYLPKKSLMPITRGLMVFYGQYGNDWTTLAAAILMLTLPIAALFLVLQRWIYAGVLQGSVRG